MQVSRRHHFVPQFLLKKWHATDGQGFWLYFRDAQNKLRTARRSAKSVAYMDELYTLRPDLPELRELGRPDALETDFFSAIDADAALVHQKLLQVEQAPLTPDDLRAWSRFLNSLMERSPSRIAEIERMAAADDDIQALLRHPVVAKLQEGPLRADLQALFRNSLLRTLKDFIDNEEHLSYFSSMRRVAIDIPASSDEHFLTGDAPLVLNVGASPAPIHLLTIALSPKRMLMMHQESDAVDQRFLDIAAKTYSIQIAKQVPQYLISCCKLRKAASSDYPRIAEEFLQLRPV